jgi:hypothetical protein
MSIQNPLFQPPSEWVCPECIDYKGQSPVAIDFRNLRSRNQGPRPRLGNR